MRREIFFLSKCVCVLFLASSCRACRSWFLLQLLPVPPTADDRCFPLPPVLSLSLSSPSSPFPNPPPCKHPSSNPHFSFLIRIACGVSKNRQAKQKGAKAVCLLYGDCKFPLLLVALFLAPLSCSCLFSLCMQARSGLEAAVPGWSSHRRCSGRNACPPRLTMHSSLLKRLAKRIM